jgi:PAS domain S-box-containing protein
MPWKELEKQAEANSPQIYRTVIEGAPAMLWLGDETGKCVFLNKLLRDFWGVALEEIPSFDWASSVHPDDVALLSGPFREAMEGQTEMQVEARYRRSDGVYRILSTFAQPRFSESGEFLGMVGVNTDVTEQRKNEEELRQTMESLTLATKASQLGWGTWDTGAGTVEWDARGREILGLPSLEATTDEWWQCIHPEDRAVVRNEMETCAEVSRNFDIVYRTFHTDGKLMRVHGTGSLKRTAEGVRGTGMIRDVTEQAREEEFQQLVIQELRHRIKNLLALVNSLVSQTRATGDAADYQSTLLGRLRALAASVGVVAYGSSGNIDLHELSEAVLRPYILERSNSVRISGPPSRVPERYGRILGLALHELTTNAVKYGALSCAEGYVELNWTYSDDPVCKRLQVVWSEKGGPAVKPPAERGFGSRLLEDIVAMETDARSDLHFDASGLRYSLDLPIEGLLAPKSAKKLKPSSATAQIG